MSAARVFIRISLCLSCSLVLAVQETVALPAGLLAWWSGETNASDLSGNGYHGTLENGAQAGIPGLLGGAFQFDGIDDSVTTPVLLFPHGTLDLWIRPATLDSIDGIFGTFGTSNGNNRLWLNVRGPEGGLGVQPTQLVVNTGSSGANEIVVPSPLAHGVWTHIALTFDFEADFYTLYSNGQRVGLSTASRHVPTRTFDFGGQRSDFGQSFYWHGLIDEVHLFNRALTSAEIWDLYTAGNNSPGSAPIPEPSTWLMLATGIIGLLGYGWWQRLVLRKPRATALRHCAEDRAPLVRRLSFQSLDLPPTTRVCL